MNAAPQNRFYLLMGATMALVVVAGFGLAALDRGLSPADYPPLFHLHGVTYLLWFGLFLVQASLIGRRHFSLHRTLGYASPLIVAAMLITGLLMAKGAYDRGVSPIPGISVQQFMAFPLVDLAGLTLFYSLAIFGRHRAVFHKHAMLLALIAILDPATARLGMAFEVPPLPLIANFGFISALIWHDRKTLGRVHALTWIGLVWILIRPALVLGVAATDGWARIAIALFS